MKACWTELKWFCRSRNLTQNKLHCIFEFGKARKKTIAKLGRALYFYHAWHRAQIEVVSDKYITQSTASTYDVCTPSKGEERVLPGDKHLFNEPCWSTMLLCHHRKLLKILRVICKSQGAAHKDWLACKQQNSNASKKCTSFAGQSIKELLRQHGLQNLSLPPVCQGF